MNRKPAVAGQFYPAEADKLKDEINKYIDIKAKKEDVLGIVVPHAGYMFSGKVAGNVYSRINFPQTFIIIGPNHQGIGAPLSIVTEGIWDTPLGTVAIDGEIAQKILDNSRILKEDSNAHLYEHSLEVQIPFMQYLGTNFQIVPISMFDYAKQTCRNLADTISKVLKEIDKKVIIVASTDMTHYETQKMANQKDKMVIDEILNLNPKGMLEIVEKYGITMCGSGPTATMLFACKDLGAKNAELILYNTSGDITGDNAQVVGYAGIIIK